jgi:SAM-dependent methyltransferase
MLDLMNNYIHGYVLTPVLISLKRKNFFEMQSTLSFLKQTTKVNQGFMKAAVSMLEILSYVTRENKDYILTINHQQKSYLEDLPLNLMDLYDLPIKSFTVEDDYTKSIISIINDILSVYEKHKNNKDAKFMLGAVSVPLFISLKLNNTNTKSHLLKEIFSFNDPSYLETYTKFLSITDMIDESKRELNLIGRFMLDRSLNMATACSYKPMLYKMDDLLFGNYKEVLSTDVSGIEQHVDRTLNVLASSFQHGTYFDDYIRIIKDMFDSDDLDSQPKYIIDMGCGNGTLLEKAYNVIKNSTRRGKHLDKYPIKLIGADFNRKSLEATTSKFNKLRIDIITIQADVTDPHDLVNKIKLLGINNIEDCLHIRSFLDHEVGYSITDKDLYDSDAFFNSETWINKQGNLISSNSMYQALVNHFKLWSEVVSKHGIIIMEVHSLNLDKISEYFNETESFHFDFLQACSFQYLVKADVFCICAAKAGLIPNFKAFKKYPKLLPYTRIQINHFIKKDYSILELKENISDVYNKYKFLITNSEVNKKQFIEGVENNTVCTFIVNDSQEESLGIICAKYVNNNENLEIIFVHTKSDSTKWKNLNYDLIQFFLHVQHLKNQVNFVSYHDLICNIDDIHQEMDRFTSDILKQHFPSNSKYAGFVT